MMLTRSSFLIALILCVCCAGCGKLPRDPEETLSRVQQSKRLREDGDVLTGEAFVVPRDQSNILDKLKQATDLANTLEWRLHDINVVVVPSIE
jgi:hypothetical protein